MRPAPSLTDAVKVALIYGVGAIQRGDKDTMADGAVMSAEKTTKAFRDAVKDPSVKAILFRIDSPGGSYTASNSIWREVGNARSAGKPVIVSMGDVAASGGYFAAMAADRIVAQPGTITGSIGVFSGKMVLADFWKKLGVSWDEIHAGQNATMWSSNTPFSATAWDRMNALLDHIYADFTGKAEQGRNIKPDAMDKIARGRIWAGDEALHAGLIDQTGGYATAIGLIRDLARLPAHMPVNLVPFPRPEDTARIRDGTGPNGASSARMGGRADGQCAPGQLGGGAEAADRRDPHRRRYAQDGSTGRRQVAPYRRLARSGWRDVPCVHKRPANQVSIDQSFRPRRLSTCRLSHSPFRNGILSNARRPWMRRPEPQPSAAQMAHK